MRKTSLLVVTVFSVAAFVAGGHLLSEGSTKSGGEDAGGNSAPHSAIEAEEQPGSERIAVADNKLASRSLVPDGRVISETRDQGLQLSDAEVAALWRRCEREIESHLAHVERNSVQAEDTEGYRKQLEAELGLASKRAILEEIKAGRFSVLPNDDPTSAVPEGGRSAVLYGQMTKEHGMVKVLVAVPETPESIALMKLISTVRRDERYEASVTFNDKPEHERVALIKQHEDATRQLAEIRDRMLEASSQGEQKRLAELAREDARLRGLLLPDGLIVRGSSVVVRRR